MAEKVNFAESAKQVVELVGGTDNITSVSHCITRVRFLLKDGTVGTANTEAIERVPGVIKVVEAAGQYQVVIGPAVEKMYDEVVAISGKAGEEVAADEGQDDAPAEKASVPQLLVKLMSGVMMPLLGPLAGCGIIASLAALLMALGVVTSDSPTYTLLYGIGQTCMYFFPVLAGCSTARHFGMDTYLGGLIGAAMMYPVVANADLSGQVVSVFGFLPITYQSYSSTVFPAVAAVAFACPIHRFLKRHIPSALTFFLVPTLTILVTVPVALSVIGPVMNLLSALLSQAVLAVYGFNPILAGAVLGGIWLPFVVPLGIHQALAVVLYMDLLATGSSSMLGLLCGIMTVSGVLVGACLRSKNTETRSLALSCALTNALGISEPGLYGIILQHKETIAALVASGAAAGVVAAVFGTTMYAMGASGIFAFPSYINPSGDLTSVAGAVLANVVGFAVGVVVVFFWPGFDPDAK